MDRNSFVIVLIFFSYKGCQLASVSWKNCDGWTWRTTRWCRRWPKLPGTVSIRKDVKMPPRKSSNLWPSFTWNYRKRKTRNRKKSHVSYPFLLLFHLVFVRFFLWYSLTGGYWWRFCFEGGEPSKLILGFFKD